MPRLLITLLLLLAGCGGDGGSSTPAPSPSGSTPTEEIPSPIPSQTPNPASEPTNPANPGTPTNSVLLTHFLFSGTLATGGTFTGELTYSSNELPNDTNVRGLAPNQTFAVESYRFALTPLYQLLPDELVFTNTDPENMIEYCSGICVFAEPAATNLILTKPGYKVQLTFDPLWGAFRPNSSSLQITGGGFLYIGIIQATVQLN